LHQVIRPARADPIAAGVADENRAHRRTATVG
jgi:hypothetical protein